MEEVFTNESFPTTSLPDMGTDDLVPQDRVSVSATEYVEQVCVACSTFYILRSTFYVQWG